MPPSDHGGLPGRLLGFAEELRDEGVAIGTAELLDAFAALGEVPWTDREDVREALAATLAKSQEDRRVFELVFERFFFRAAESEALDRGERDARPRPARHRRVRAPGRGLRRDRRRRAADPPGARPALGTPARSPRGRSAARGPPARRAARLRGPP